MGLVRSLGRRFRCHHSDALTGAGRWGLRQLTYWQAIAYMGMEPARVTALYQLALAQWSAVCGLSFVPVEDIAQAHIVARSATIDGPWNVLALSELPPTPAFGGVLRQTFDSQETLSEAEILACMCHEIGHVIGLGHSAQGSGNLMDPFLSPAVTRPQAGDIRVARGFYGLPAPPPPPEVPGSPPPVPPAGDPSPVPPPVIPPGSSLQLPPQLVTLSIPGHGTMSLSLQQLAVVLGFTPA